MNGLLILLILISIIACILGFTNFYKKYEYNKDIEEKNNQLKKEYDKISGELTTLFSQCEIQRFEESKIKKNIEELKQIEQSYEDTAHKSFTNYCEALDKEYQKKEEEYLQITNMLINNYNIEQDKFLQEQKQLKQELNKMRQTRAAAMEAARKEKEIEENSQFYSITLETKDRNDIQALERVKKELNNPRILSMLIWTTFFRDKVTELCNNVLGTKTITGIYKITNQETKECYIGQSVDIAKRWKDHAKSGLDIDRPQGNKLYQNMLEYGLWNFTFELLEECPKEQLNEKEKFYISLYDSCNYGFNSTIGNK